MGQRERYRTEREAQTDQQRGAGIGKEIEQDGSPFSSHFSLPQVFSYFPFVSSPSGFGSLGSV